MVLTIVATPTGTLMQIVIKSVFESPLWFFDPSLDLSFLLVPAMFWPVCVVLSVEGSTVDKGIWLVLKPDVEVSDLPVGASDLGEVEKEELKVIAAIDDTGVAVVSGGMTMSVTENG